MSVSQEGRWEGEGGGVDGSETGGVFSFFSTVLSERVTGLSYKTRQTEKVGLRGIAWSWRIE
jgi:hypothetical protein